MTIGKRKYPRLAAIVSTLSLSLVLFGSPGMSQATDAVSKDLARAGGSIKDASRQTGDYLKSDTFHKDLKRFTDGLSDAIKKGGDWLGQKLGGGPKSK